MSETTADCAAGRVSINILPDDILLLIFHFDRVTYIDGLAAVDYGRRLLWRWHRLVHVCQRWRSIVFASPKFLDLALVCGPSTPMELIDIWPPFPIIIRDRDYIPIPKDYDFQAAFAHPNRVLCQIDIRHISSLLLQQLASVLQERFPALIHFRFGAAYFFEFPPQALPDGFLGGSSPRLQSLELNSISFTALPKFLLSTNDLVLLSLRNVLYSGHVAPGAIIPSLVVLANLKYLIIGFSVRQPHPDQEGQRPPPPTRAVLSALTLFKFQGPSKYLDVFVARIDAPLLDSFSITFIDHRIFEISQLAQFMRRTTRIQTLNEAHVDFDYYDVQVEFRPPTLTLDEKSGLTIKFRAVNSHLSDVVHVFTLLYTSIFTVEHLYMYGPRSFLRQWQDPIQWLDFFQPFTAVKILYLVKELAQHIAPTLQGLVGERATDVFPALEGLYLEEFRPPRHVRKAIRRFIAARQLLGRLVAVSRWKTDLTLMSGVT